MPAPAASTSNTTSRWCRACITTASTSARCWKWYRLAGACRRLARVAVAQDLKACGQYALRQDLAAQNRRRFYPKWPARRMAAPCGSIGGQRVRAELDHLRDVGRACLAGAIRLGAEALDVDGERPPR